MNQERAKRLEIVNAIMKEMGSRGRGFFGNKDKGNFAQLLYRGTKLFYKCEFRDIEICISIPEYRKPRRWMHGGTLWALTKDFRDYVKDGGDTNHRHGYGGLYCQHWGYPDEDMKAIRDKAIELGYLQQLTKNNS